MGRRIASVDRTSRDFQPIIKTRKFVVSRFFLLSKLRDLQYIPWCVTFRLGENVMSFDLEGILDSAKEKVVEAATEKFGASATPIAENVANKMEEIVAGKMGVPLQGKTDPAATDSEK